MTPEDKEIQELRRRVQTLEGENEALQRQHYLDQSEMTALRRRLEAMADGTAAAKYPNRGGRHP